MNQIKNKPCIVCFSGLDPTGGAGIQADIETLAAHFCHCLPLITLNSVQDSKTVYSIHATDIALLKEQYQHLNSDIEISAIKIGMLANCDQVDFLTELITELRTGLRTELRITLKDIPIILDPVFASGLGTKTASQNQIFDTTKKLLPICTLITPNIKEAVQLAQVIQPSLSNKATISEIASIVLSTGVENVLITGTHSDNNTTTIEHQLFSKGLHKIFSVMRLANEYHGSGCTLASAITAKLAHGVDLETAIQQGLNFTENALNGAQPLGKHQLFPNRFQE
jgi:hydroxymethylpyrimidine/phosphomethylpyrimidine kinase